MGNAELCLAMCLGYGDEDWQEGSADKGIWCQAWGPQFDPHMWWKERTSAQKLSSDHHIGTVARTQKHFFLIQWSHSVESCSARIILEISETWRTVWRVLDIIAQTKVLSLFPDDVFQLLPYLYTINIQSEKGQTQTHLSVSSDSSQNWSRI